MAKNQQSAPPAGTGHAPGLGETFSINLSTGQGTYVYQMPVPDGVAKHTPQLTLEYAHGAGHGAWGLGWRMGLRAISRRLDFGTPDEGLIERFLDGGSEIMPSSDGTFRAIRETLFSRYTRVGDGWRVEDRNGMVHELGLTPNARIAHPDHPARVVEWLLERTRDTSGNEIRYTYRIDNGIAYPDTIQYAIYEIRFLYESRPDVRHDGRAGFSRRRALRCSAVELIVDPGVADEQRIRSWRFGYGLAPGSGVSLLNDITLTAHGTAPDGSLDVLRPPIRFRYSDFDPMQFHVRWMDSEGSTPPDLNAPDVALVTLDNAPLPGILQNKNGREYYWANRGNGLFAAPRPLPAAPLASSFARKGLAFVDMDGSGTADLMVADSDALQGFYENGGREGWHDFVAFPRAKRSTPNWSDRNLRLMDADGDGLVDALTSQKRALVWWRNEGKQGWTEPFLIPKTADGLSDIDFSDPDVHLADMSGDGLPDIVRVQSGRVEYWPNLGRGRFGEPVLMQNAPRLRRNGRGDVLLLTDLDGDGCADLVLFTSAGLTICQNQNGNRFADPVLIDTIPPPLAGTVRALNLNGRAGTGLLWNSLTQRGPGYVQFEFANDQPPYVLSQIENGAGLQSELRYRSAVDDYLRDQQQGRFWTTNFPFPYLVVASTKETDTVSGRVAETEMRYHEAHFDRHTRQFQGFRQTERLEKGDGGQSRHDTLQVHTFLMAQEREPGNGPEHAGLNGMLNRVEFFDLDGPLLEQTPSKTETSTYDLSVLETAPDGRKRSFLFVTSSRTDDTERTSDVRTEEKFYAYDAVGNVIQERLLASGTRAGVDQPTRERVTDLQFATSSTRYLLDKPVRSTVRDGNGQLLTEKHLFYDGPDFVGLPMGKVDRGLVSREEEWVLTQAEFNAHYAGMTQVSLGYISGLNADGVASVFATTQQARFNAQGLVVATRDVFGTEARLTYDASGLFRQKMTDPLGQTSFVYDRATGQITKTTYPDGTITQFAYDAQGRVLRSALPGQTLANSPSTYAYDETVIPNRRTVTFRQQDGSTSQGVTYYDGYGKDFQQRVEVEAGKVLVSALKLYNPWGDLRQEFEPTFDNTLDFGLPNLVGQPSRQFFYDGRGRAIRTINYNGSISTVEFQPFKLITRDANDTDDSVGNIGRGQFDTPHIEEFDVLRYLVQVTEKVGLTKEVTTRYETGPMGELLTVRDGRSVKFSYRYDRQGNRLAVSLRESGDRKFFYDARKRLVRSIDGSGNDIRATWDTVGRMTQLKTGATVLETYQYDTPARNAFGRLAEVRYAGGKQAFTYDPAGRLIQHDYFHDAGTAPYSLRYQYDVLGREIACLHPDGTRIEKELLANGWLKAMPGAIKQVQYDPRGLATDVLFQNDVQTSYTYTAGPGRVSQQTTTGPGNVTLEAVAFGFDKMEMMLSSNDSAPDGVGLRKYSYDPLYQLKSMESVENGNPVRRAYDYADDYNLSRFDEGKSTLRYEDVNHPDRLTSLTPDGGVRFTVDYDSNGNLLNLPDQQFAYNAKNELTRFIRQDGLVADYRYDHGGQRISKRIDDGQGNIQTIRYVGEVAEIRSLNGGPDEVIIFVRMGGRRVAVRQGGNVRFIHENGLGSTAFITDELGQRVGKQDFLPFGNEGSSSGTVDFKTFALHPVDHESGLV